LTNTVSDLVAWSIIIDEGSLDFLASFGFDGDGNMYVMDIFGGDVFLVANAINDVPLPSALFLMAAGLFGLRKAARKKPGA